MGRNKSKHVVAIPRVMVKFESFNVHSCQFGTICLSFRSILLNLVVKYDLPQRTYYCDSSTSLPLQDGLSCLINRQISQFSNL